ncbi:MAG: nucleotidyltransferase domain-containing protein [Verrucomicrobiota bacterium]|nr:nucleotidyltransferase domain-containing protein [Verrucomicrobiota bacterium]
MQDIQRYCDAIAAAYRPQRIILFGSHAYGEPDLDSDVDALVVMPTSKRLKPRVSLEIRERIEANFPVDIIVRDPAFVAARLHEGDTFLQEITGKGGVMYEGRDA